MGAYQLGVLELDALEERCGRIAEERTRVSERLRQLQQQQHEHTQHELLGVTLGAFCRNTSEALRDPSFETKQRILWLVVDKILVTDEEVTSQHVVLLSDAHVCGVAIIPNILVYLI